MIENVQLSDDGTYYCEATNDAGKDSQKTDLRNGFILFSNLGIELNFSGVVIVKLWNSHSRITLNWS